MRFLGLFAILALIFVESALAATQTVTKCTATNTKVITQTTSKTTTKTITKPPQTVTTSIVKTQLKTVSLTVTKSPSTVTRTLTSTLKSTLSFTITSVATTTATTTATTITTETTTQKACAPTFLNVVPNGDFEHGLDGWNPQGTSLSARCDGNADWVRSGNCAVAVLFPGATSDVKRIERTVTICRGFRYRVLFLVKITGSCTMQVSVDSPLGPPVGATSWSQNSYELVSGPFTGFPTEEVPVRIEFLSGKVGGCAVSLDAFSLEAINPETQT